jgi:uncharacterized protein YciI
MALNDVHTFIKHMNRMKNRTHVLILILSLLAAGTCLAQSTNTVYDEALAKRLGGQNGLKKYVMAFLKAGPNRPKDSTLRAQLQNAHMENIQRMADAGKLLVAGPFLDDMPLRGIYIFNVETLEEAKALTETDPAIKAGSLVMELHPWMASSALQEIPRIHRSIVKPK